MPARQSGAKFCLAAWDAMVREESFLHRLGDVHDAMLWLGAQLRVHLVLG